MEEYKQENSGTAMDDVLERLERIRRFSGPPTEFWPAFMEEAARLVNARLGVLLVWSEESASWKKLFVWQSGAQSGAVGPEQDARMLETAQAAALQGVTIEKSNGLPEKKSPAVMVGVRLKIEDDRSSVAVFLIDRGCAHTPEEAAVRLTLLADSPAVYQLSHLVAHAKSDMLKFSEALDLMTLLNAEEKYMAAAMTFCNEIASRYACDRVSLGWIKGAYVRVQAISHMERFEKKMDVVQNLETAMEEAFDQDEEILWPKPEKSLFIARDHEAFSRDQGSRNIVSLALRLDEKPVGVVTCERSDTPFSEEEVRGLRVLCDQATRRLGDLKHNDRWFGAKMVTSGKDLFGKFFGVEHTFAKGVGIIVCVLLAVFVFGKLNYRVEAPFILKTDDLAYVPAPFDGYIHKVNVKIGDQIRKMDTILSLDTRELLLEESTAVANLKRYSSEAVKARSKNALSDMQVSLALEEQAKAKLDLVRYHLDHADVKAPFDGIVVEGDLKKLLGAPVKKGDVLLKIARIAKMYAELKVDEKDIQDVRQGATGQIAFVSRPDLKFPVTVQRIDPVSVPDEKKNVFLVRVTFPEKVSSWWRPGMSGVAKINVGKRNILWIFTHRTVDFLRIFFWW